MTRIEAFRRCRAEDRAALATYVVAGDPEPETSLAILKALPKAGADIVELGLPFTDPMADGRRSGGGLKRRSRPANDGEDDHRPPLPEERRGHAGDPHGLLQPDLRLRRRALPRQREERRRRQLIFVDLPPEEDDELCLPALAAGLAFIRLATPTTDDRRLPAVLANTAGFVYYVSITGITGAATPDFARVSDAVARIKRHTALPVVVGFGVKTGAHAAAIAQGADGVAVGTALVNAVQGSLDAESRATSKTVESVVKLVQELAVGVRSVSKAKAA